jgi:hypothetical protein
VTTHTDASAEPALYISDGRVDLYLTVAQVLGVSRDCAKKLVLQSCYSGGMNNSQRKDAVLRTLLFGDTDDAALRARQREIVRAFRDTVDMIRMMVNTPPAPAPESAAQKIISDANEEQRKLDQMERLIAGRSEVAVHEKDLARMREAPPPDYSKPTPYRTPTDEELKRSIAAIMEDHPELWEGFNFSRLVTLLHECQALGTIDDVAKEATLYVTHPVRQRVVNLWTSLRDAGGLAHCGFKPHQAWSGDQA